MSTNPLETFRRITRWMQANAPDVAAQLRGPASNDDLRAADEELGVALPEELRVLLREHDGNEDGGFWGFLQFVPTASLVAAREDLMEWVKTDREYSVSSRNLYPEVYAELASDEWIAIGHQGYADLLALHAKTGRVFTAGKDIPALVLAAPSLSAYLASYADELEAGTYRIEEGFGGWYLERDD